MNKIKMLKFVYVQLLFVASIGLSSTVIAEEWLSKGEAKYLGWRAWYTSEIKFRTCSNDLIPIEDGKIEEADEKCPKNGTPAPLVAIVTYVDVNNRALQVKNENGKLFNFFFPETAEIISKIKLKDIKIGDKVTVTSPVAGRAEAIKIPVVTEKNKLSPAYDKSKDMDNIKDKL